MALAAKKGGNEQERHHGKYNILFSKNRISLRLKNISLQHYMLE
jgi:hypothetical protein